MTRRRLKFLGGMATLALLATFAVQPGAVGQTYDGPILVRPPIYVGPSIPQLPSREPGISLNPTCAPENNDGVPVDIAGSGFPGGLTVQFTLDDYDNSVPLPGGATADDNGNFVARTMVPTGTNDALITVRNDGEYLKSATLAVPCPVTPDPGCGAPGTPPCDTTTTTTTPVTTTTPITPDTPVPRTTQPGPTTPKPPPTNVTIPLPPVTIPLPITTLPPPVGPVTPPGAPSLRVDPPIGPPGLATMATGAGFAPNAPVDLGWLPGLGRVRVLTDGAGGFRTSMLVLYKDALGPRQLVAFGPTGAATALFLVVQPPVKPPRFVFR